MYNSTKSINIPFYWTSDKLLKLIRKNLLKNYKEGLLRLYLFLSPLYGYKNLNSVESKILCSLLTEKTSAVHNAKLYISDIFRYSKDYLVKHKLTQRAHLILATKLYQQKGAHESLLLNENGYITEGTRSNIFFFKNDRFFTPSLETGILPGVTRKKVIEIIKREGYEVEEGFYTKKDLVESEEIFLTYTTVGITPIAEIVDENKKFKIEKSLHLLKCLEEEISTNNEYFRVLFVCKENSIRSIMAEAITNKLSAGKIKAISAGVKSSQINPLTKKILLQKGFSVNNLYSKQFSPEILKDIDFVITVCDLKSCINLSNLDEKTTLYRWNVSEPSNTEEDFHRVYNEIELKCKELINFLLPK
jgi:branched-subunit amino acid aminotransferase/4-amino-4-deoxychorismate lyase/protein-tyrosine-phosphatase